MRLQSKLANSTSQIAEVRNKSPVHYTVKVNKGLTNMWRNTKMAVTSKYNVTAEVSKYEEVIIMT